MPIARFATVKEFYIHIFQRMSYILVYLYIEQKPSPLYFFSDSDIFGTISCYIFVQILDIYFFHR